MASPEAVVQREIPVNFAKFLRTPILKNICERLLLHLKYCTPANNTAEPVAKYKLNSNSKRKKFSLELRRSFFLTFLNLE